MWDRQFATIATGNTVAQDLDPIADYLALDTETNITVDEYRVDIDLTTTSEIEPLVDGDVCCYFKNDTVTIDATVTLNRPGADPNLNSISFKVIDPEGIDISDVAWVYPLNLSPIQIDFPLTKLGAYTVTATVEDTVCDNTFEHTITVETCNFIFIKYLGCNSFEVQNRSLDTDIEYTLLDVGDAAFSETGTLAAQSAITFDFTRPSIYEFQARYGEDTVQSYLLNNYCEIERCFIDYIEQILCAPVNRCSPCPPESEISQMFLMYNAYFMKINKIFNLNSFHTALDQEGLDEVTTATQIMDKILLYCERTGCLTNGAFSEGYMTEGPYDWAGQGSNRAQSCSCNPKKSGSYYNAARPGYCATCNGKV
jgi:hypothetical protein